MAGGEEHFSARLALLDKQLVDADDLPVGRVDDVELSESPGTAPRVEAILTGAQALGERLGGLVGRSMAGPAERLRPGSETRGPVRIEPQLIEHLEPMVKLRASLSDLPHVAGLERWLGQRVIGLLPGAGDAVE